MPITVTESELAGFFGVAAKPSDPQAPWPNNDFLFEVSSDGLFLSCVVAPGYKDISLVLKRGDARLYELNAAGVVDICRQLRNEQEVLAIILSEEEIIWLKLRPTMEIRQSFPADS